MVVDLLSTQIVSRFLAFLSLFKCMLLNIGHREPVRVDRASLLLD